MSASGLGSRAIIGRFYATLNAAAPGWVNQIGFLQPSDQASETYKWLGQVPQLREWIGGRQAKGFSENGLTIANKEFEATLNVFKNEMRRDKTGQVMVRVEELAKRAASHWASLVSTLVNNGASGICYDGQFFFDTDHTEGANSTNQSNKKTVTVAALAVTNKGSTTSPSAGTMREASLQAVQTILGFKDNENEPLNEDAKEFTLMVPVTFYSAALAAVGLPTVDVGEGNILNAMATQDSFNFRVVPNVRITATDTFYVFRSDAKIKPFILQEEVPLEMTAIAEGSELEFKERRHEYGVYASRNVGYGMWQQAVSMQLI